MTHRHPPIRHADIDNNIPSWYIKDINQGSNNEKANIHLAARGYDLCFASNGNITATKGENTVRLVPLANYGVYIDTPTVTAITRKDATDAEALRIIAGLTA